MSPRLTARLLAAAVIVAGLANVASALTPALHARLHTLNELLTSTDADYAAGATALFGIALVLIGRGVAQRRRAAHHVAVVLLLLSTLAHLAKGLDIEEAAFTFVLALLLVLGRKVFVVSPPRAHWQQFARAVPTVIAIDFTYGIVALYLRHKIVHPHLNLGLALRETGARLIGMSGPLRFDHAFGHFIPTSLTVLGIASMSWLVLLALAPVAEQAVSHRHERDRVRALIDRTDGDTLDPFALRSDKRYVFSDDGQAAVAYRYVGGVGLASGDPVGAPESHAGAFANYMALCEKHGWRPGVVGAREDRAPLYERHGMRGIYLGDEAVLDVQAFNLVGRKFRNVRQSMQHTHHEGVTSEVHGEGDLDPTLRRALIGIAERHRGRQPERGFSMALGALLSGRDPACVIAVARDKVGTPIAFQRYIPCKAGTALSLDAMRRDRGSPNGVNERLIIDTMAWAKEQGYLEASLNFAAFREIVDDESDLSFAQSGAAWVIKKLNPFFQIESLRKFNNKFRPHWVRRSLYYRSVADVGAVALAALNAEALLPFQKREDEEHASGAHPDEPQPGEAAIVPTRDVESHVAQAE